MVDGLFDSIDIEPRVRFGVLFGAFSSADSLPAIFRSSSRCAKWLAFCEAAVLLLPEDDDDGANGVGAVIVPLLLLLFDVTAAVTDAVVALAIAAAAAATEEVLWWAWVAGDDLDDVDD